MQEGPLAFVQRVADRRPDLAEPVCEIGRLYATLRYGPVSYTHLDVYKRQGIKSLIMNRAVIGKHCLIGANSLIPEGKVIPDGSLVMGSPGKIVRSLSTEEIERLRQTAGRYVDNFKRFKRELCGQN